MARLWQKETRRRLVEPFCGGLAITLGLQPKTALLNDINPHLINFYRFLKAGLVVDGMRFENKSAAYYASRARFNKLLKQGKAGSPQAAALFYYLNRTGYNGLCRFNQSGGFNVPFGSARATSTTSTIFRSIPILLRVGNSRTHTSVRFHFDETTSSTPTRHMTSSSASTEGWLWLGGAGRDCGVAIEASRPCRALEPGDQADRRAV